VRSRPTTWRSRSASGVRGQHANAAALNAGLGKIGVKPDQVAKVASELTGYVTKAPVPKSRFFANSIK